LQCRFPSALFGFAPLADRRDPFSIVKLFSLDDLRVTLDTTFNPFCSACQDFLYLDGLRVLLT
jgi:hypothetical protein